MSQPQKNKKISLAIMNDFQKFIDKEIRRVNEDITICEIKAKHKFEDYFESGEFYHLNLLQYQKAFLANFKEKVGGLTRVWDLLDELRKMLDIEICKLANARSRQKSANSEYGLEATLTAAHDWAYYFLSQFTAMAEEFLEQ